MTKRRGLALTDVLISAAAVALMVCAVLPSAKHAASVRGDLMCVQNQSCVWKALTLYAADWDGRFTTNMLLFTDDNQFPDGSHGVDYRLPWSNALVRVPRSKLDDPARAEGDLISPGAEAAEREDGDIWQSPVAYLPDMSVCHCPMEDRAQDFLDASGEGDGGAYTWHQIYNDWWYDIMGSYGLNMRMSTWHFMNHYNVALPAECYLFADSWGYGFDHTSGNDNWFQTRHGPAGDVVNVMFHDGHTEGLRYAPPVDEIPTLDGVAYGRGTPWWGGDTQWKN